MERAQEGRVRVLDSFLARLREEIDKKIPPEVQRSISSAADLTPIVNSYKMSLEAATGKTAAGERLSPRDRILYSLIVGTNLGAAGLATAGNFKMAGASYGASWVLFALQRGPNMAKDVKEMAMKYGVPALEKLVDGFEGMDLQETYDLVGR